MPAALGARSSSLGALKSHMRSIGSLPSLVTPSFGSRRSKVEPISDASKPDSRRGFPSPKIAFEERQDVGCETPSTGRSLCSRGSSLSSSIRSTGSASPVWSSVSSRRSSTPARMVASKEGTPTRRASEFVSATLGRADRPRTRKSAAAVLGPRAGEESCDHSSSTTQLLAALRSVAFAAPPEVTLSKSGANDVAEVCKMAKVMHVQVSEMQRHFVLFRKYAYVEEGASLVKDGRLNRDQFCQLVADNLFEGSQVETGRCVDRAFAVADNDGTGLVSFEKFALWMTNHQTFDVNIHVDAREREMRGIAREYKISVVEVDKYRRMFEELANASINRIERSSLPEMLHRCANVPRDLGLSPAREQALWNSADPTQRGCIDFEEFLVFNLKFFAKGA